MDKFMNHKKGVTARLHPFFRYYEQKLSKNFIKKLKLSIYMGGGMVQFQKIIIDKLGLPGFV